MATSRTCFTKHFAPWPNMNPPDKQQEWIESLPANCPPSDANKPDGKTAYFRICDSFPAKDLDFMSHRHRSPNHIFKVGKCREKSVSLYTSLEICRSYLNTAAYPNKVVVSIVLAPECGLIKQTSQPTHYSWWRKHGFKPAEVCSLCKNDGPKT